MKNRGMNRLSLRLLCQLYLALLLLAGTILSSLPYSPLALLLLLAVLFIIFRPLAPRFDATIVLAVMFLLPLILEPVLSYLTRATLLPTTVPQAIAAVAIIPALYLLDYALRQNAQHLPLVHTVKWRHTTSVARALLASVLALVLVSLVINNRALLFTSVILVVYLLVTLILAFRGVPRPPLNVPLASKRIIAGTTADITLHATSGTSMRLHCLLTPVEPWLIVSPQRFTLNEARIALSLTVTPPLAGPVMPQLQVSATDHWGLVQVNQIVKPVELHVIPRARYAEWLAIRYLEQTGARAEATSTSLPSITRMPQRGTEYHDSRTYQPGDRLRDIDWKHTLKLGQLIVKEYIETAQQGAIIAVNLSVTDAEEADKLAFNLITTALTLAHEAIPSALAVYDHERVVLTTTVTNSRETLKQTLSLVKDISQVELAQRYLQPPDIRKLNRNIILLKPVTSEAAQRLLAMLDFEVRAVEAAAKNHPATLALLHVAERVSPPALIILVSQPNHDAEALLVTTQKLAKRGFTTLPLPSAKDLYTVVQSHCQAPG